MGEAPDFIDDIEAVLGQDIEDEVTITKPGFTKLSENFQISLLSSYQLPHWGHSGVFSFPEASWDWTEFINFILFSCEVHKTSIETALNFSKECLTAWTNLVAERIEDAENKEAFIEVYNRTMIEIVVGSGVGTNKLVRVTLGDELVTSGVFEITKLRRMNSLRGIAAEVLAGILHDQDVVKELDIPKELKEFMEEVVKDDWREVDAKFGWNPIILMNAMKKTGQWDGVEAIQKYMKAKNERILWKIPFPNIEDCASSTVDTKDDSKDSGKHQDWDDIEEECQRGIEYALGVEMMDNGEPHRK